MWALGILLFELCHGQAPYRAHTRDKLAKGQKANVVFKPKVSAEYKDLINKLLVKDPEERIELIEVFDHPWVRNFQRKFFPNH